MITAGVASAISGSERRAEGFSLSASIWIAQNTLHDAVYRGLDSTLKTWPTISFLFLFRPRTTSCDNDYKNNSSIRSISIQPSHLLGMWFLQPARAALDRQTDQLFAPSALSAQRYPSCSLLPSPFQSWLLPFSHLLLLLAATGRLVVDSGIVFLVQNLERSHQSHPRHIITSSSRGTTTRDATRQRLLLRRQAP